MIEKYDKLYNSAIQLKSKYDTLVSQLDQVKQTKIETVKKMETKYHTQVIYEESIAYMKEIIDSLSRSQINHLEKLLNSAVQTIFFDRNYRIEFEIAEYRNSNSLTIFLVETTTEGEIRTDIKNNGFGIKTIVGFILQVYFILYHKLAPIMFIDEGFSALSEAYIPFLRSLIQSLAKEYQFTFVLVSHDPRFINIADRTYEVKNGDAKLVV